MKRRVGTALILTVLALLAGCGQADKEKAQQRAAEARRKADEAAARAREEAHKLAREAKQEARALNHKINDALNGTGTGRGGDSSAAGQKLQRGGEDVRRAGNEAEVKLNHAALIARVKAKLANDVGLSTVTSVDVDASGRVVTLRGTVSSPEQKQQAENAVRQVNGVDRVINDLEVRP
jgi:osmotically-inducible protein OsmY